MTYNVFSGTLNPTHFTCAWELRELRTRLLCLVVADTADTTVVSTVSATTRHDRFFYLPTKDLAPFSIHIPTKNPLPLLHPSIVATVVHLSYC